MLESPSSFFSWYVLYPCYLLDVRPCASSSIHLFYYLSVWVPPLSILGRVRSIFLHRPPRYWFIWWDFWNRVWFRVFIFFWVTLFSLSIWWNPLLIFSDIRSFLFQREFWVFPDGAGLYFPLVIFYLFKHGKFSIPNSIPISFNSLYNSGSFSFLTNILISFLRGVIYFLLWLCKFVAPSTSSYDVIKWYHCYYK